VTLRLFKGVTKTTAANRSILSAMGRLAEPVVRHWDFPRGVASVCLLARFAAERGVAEPDVLAGTGITPAHLTDPTGEVDAHQELAVVRNLVDALADRPGLGLAVGSRYHVTTFGMLGFAFISSRTLLDAVNVALRYLDLSFTFSMPRASLVGAQVRLELDDSALPGDVAAFLVERDLAAIHTVIGELLPGGIPLRELCFRAEGSAEDDAYRAVFGVTPMFGCTSNAATFDVAHLDRPLPQANPQTVAVCEAQCRALVSARRRRTGIAHEVRELLAGLGALGGDMNEVADQLNLSVRTLRRRLADAGTSFRALLDEVREALAEEMLATSALSVEDVAVRLGYAEASSFIHAFRRWKGVTPAAYARGRRSA
jgi:AraC-like DNA-binding protein